ncbi:MAG: hypothetical protein JRD89_04745 [Deltaproteobacteria bacterium]|nr:hypothetical protein [Deltaproteobacteria bacterium]
MSEIEDILKLRLDAITCRKLKGDLDEEGNCVLRVRYDPDDSESPKSLQKVVIISEGASKERV